jgi:hypothetical protein
LADRSIFGLIDVSTHSAFSKGENSWEIIFTMPTIYRGSIRSGHRPIGAELEQMVIIKGLFMEVVFIVIQHPLSPLYPVVKDEFQFRPLNFTHKFLMAVRRSSGPGKSRSASTAFM